jgi:hypothetical protein
MTSGVSSEGARYLTQSLDYKGYEQASGIRKRTFEGYN